MVIQGPKSAFTHKPVMELIRVVTGPFFRNPTPKVKNTVGIREVQGRVRRSDKLLRRHGFSGTASRLGKGIHCVMVVTYRDQPWLIEFCSVVAKGDEGSVGPEVARVDDDTSVQLSDYAVEENLE